MEQRTVTIVCLRAAMVRTLAKTWVLESVEFMRLQPQVLHDAWLYCRQSSCIIGRARAVHINRDTLELVDPWWMSRPVYIGRPRAGKTRVLRQTAPFEHLPEVQEFLAGGNRGVWPSWWKVGYCPSNVLQQIEKSPYGTTRPIPMYAWRKPWRGLSWDWAWLRRRPGGLWGR